MSSPTVHICQSLGSMAVLYPVLGENAIVFGASVLLIDIDHIFEYVADTKSFHPKGLFVYNDLRDKNLDKNFKVLHLFHTIVCYLLLFWLAHVYPVFYYVIGGFLFHTSIILFFEKPFINFTSTFIIAMSQGYDGNILSEEGVQLGN